MKWTPIIVALALAACGDDENATDPQTHALTVYGEEFVEDHIPADETDGWRIEFDTFLVVVQGVSAGDDAVDGAYLFDLAKSSGGDGHPLDALPDGPYPTLEYRVAPAAEIAAVNASASQVQAMVDGGYAVWVQGSATRDDVTKTFTWGFDTDTRYLNCETEPATVDDKTVRSTLTIHADHLFYDDLVSDEPNVAFDLIAQADADDDGDVTQEELAATDITALSRYQVGSRGEITDLWAFIYAQTGTLGHIDGEGHCDFE